MSHAHPRPTAQALGQIAAGMHDVGAVHTTSHAHDAEQSTPLHEPGPGQVAVHGPAPHVRPPLHELVPLHITLQELDVLQSIALRHELGPSQSMVHGPEPHAIGPMHGPNPRHVRPRVVERDASITPGLGIGIRIVHLGSSR